MVYIFFRFQLNVTVTILQAQVRLHKFGCGLACGRGYCNTAVQGTKLTCVQKAFCLGWLGCVAKRLDGCVPGAGAYVPKTGTPSPFPNGLESEGVQ